MNPFAINASLMALLCALLLSFLYIPLINQHLIKNQENLLNTKAHEVIIKNRNAKNLIVSKLQNLEIAGLKINSVNIQSLDDYLIYEINFSHQSLLKNNFFKTSTINSSQKNIYLTVDK
jgi:hypothetical protein